MKLAATAGAGLLAIAGAAPAPPVQTVGTYVAHVYSSQTVRLPRGSTGPWFCPAGVVAEARIEGLAPLGVSVVPGRLGPNGLLATVSGPTCITPAAADGRLVCFKLNKAAPVDVNVAVTCAS